MEDEQTTQLVPTPHLPRVRHYQALGVGQGVMKLIKVWSLFWGSSQKFI